jgi:hypothetical protein
METVTVSTRWRCAFLSSTVTSRASPFGSWSRPISAAARAASRSAASKLSNSKPVSSGMKRAPSRMSK